MANSFKKVLSVNQACIVFDFCHTLIPVKLRAFSIYYA